jgi:threonine/homoserine/homoserine lactone efflux protein
MSLESWLAFVAAAAFAGSVRHAMSSPRVQRGFNLAGGSLLSAAGV